MYVNDLDRAGSIRLRTDMSYKDNIFSSDDEKSVSFDLVHADGYTIYNAGIS